MHADCVCVVVLKVAVIPMSSNYATGMVRVDSKTGL